MPITKIKTLPIYLNGRITFNRKLKISLNVYLQDTRHAYKDRKEERVAELPPPS